MGIASPFDVWCAGIEAVLQRSGHVVVGRWASLEDAGATLTGSAVDLLILARRLLGKSAAGARPVQPYSGAIVLVLEPDDSFSAEDFVALDVEGLVLSTSHLDEVLQCIGGVEQGRRWIDPGVRDLLGHAQRPVPNYGELSARELEVARLAALGFSNKRIARALQVSDGTIKMHMHHILAKLRLASRVDLIWSFQEHAEEIAALIDSRELRLVVPPVA